MENKECLAKTEICEIAPRPSVVTFDLLKMIYTDNGPVARVYKNFGVRYFDTGFLQVINGELWVDREREVKSLLPAYSYFVSHNEQPKFSDWSKVFPTLRNLWFLNFVSTKNFEQLFLDLKDKIETPERPVDLKTFLDVFFNDYQLVFLVNFLSGLAIKRMTVFLKKEPVSFPEIIESSSLFVDWKKYFVSCPTGLLGNSLEISDCSDFLSTSFFGDQVSEGVKLWWNNLSEFKKRLFKSKITEAVVYNHLRELGRWLTVKKISSLRKILLSSANKNNFIDPENIFSLHLNDLLVGKIDENSCLKNKESVSKTEADTPRPLSLRKNSLLGVSAGEGEGILCRVEDIDNGRFVGNKIILYTELLSPNLTEYFSQIVGIVSATGSMLSHLAIVGREKSLPVIVGFSLANNSIKIGDKIKINGGRGEIIKVN